MNKQNQRLQSCWGAVAPDPLKSYCYQMLFLGGEQNSDVLQERTRNEEYLIHTHTHTHIHTHTHTLTTLTNTHTHTYSYTLIHTLILPGWGCPRNGQVKFNR